MALSMIFLAAVLYLAAVGAFKEAFLTVEELKDTQTILEYGTETVLPQQDGSGRSFRK